jgi:hypothetical protein
MTPSAGLICTMQGKSKHAKATDTTTQVGMRKNQSPRAQNKGHRQIQN